MTVQLCHDSILVHLDLFCDGFGIRFGVCGFLDFFFLFLFVIDTSFDFPFRFSFLKLIYIYSAHILLYSYFGFFFFLRGSRLKYM